MRESSHCTICGCELTSGLDTFGDWDAPLCWGCWLEKIESVCEALDNLLLSTQISIRRYRAKVSIAAIWAANAEEREG
jgi:hypothetical protein